MTRNSEIEALSEYLNIDAALIKKDRDAYLVNSERYKVIDIDTAYSELDDYVVNEYDYLLSKCPKRVQEYFNSSNNSDFLECLFCDFGFRDVFNNIEVVTDDYLIYKV